MADSFIHSADERRRIVALVCQARAALTELGELAPELKGALRLTIGKLDTLETKFDAMAGPEPQ